MENYAISNDIYEGFLKLFCDRNPLHIDSEFAKEKGFQSRVMHGNILNGFISYFIGECLPVKNVIIHSQQIQFKNPIYLNDKLKLEVEVIGVFESVNSVEFRFVFFNTLSKKVAIGKFQIGLLK